MKAVKPAIKGKSKQKTTSKTDKKIILNSELRYNFQLLTSLQYVKLGGITGKILWKNKSAILEAEKDFDGVRITLCEQYSEKEEDGTPIKKDGVYQFSTEALKEFNIEMQKVLDANSGVILHLISPGIIDQYEDLTGQQVEALMFMSTPE